MTHIEFERDFMTHIESYNFWKKENKIDLLFSKLKKIEEIEIDLEDGCIIFSESFFPINGDFGISIGVSISGPSLFPPNTEVTATMDFRIISTNYTLKTGQRVYIWLIVGRRYESAFKGLNLLLDQGFRFAKCIVDDEIFSILSKLYDRPQSSRKFDEYHPDINMQLRWLVSYKKIEDFSPISEHLWFSISEPLWIKIMKTDICNRIVNTINDNINSSLKEKIAKKVKANSLSGMTRLDLLLFSIYDYNAYTEFMSSVINSSNRIQHRYVIQEYEILKDIIKIVANTHSAYLWGAPLTWELLHNNFQTTNLKYLTRDSILKFFSNIVPPEIDMLYSL
jgi:hypothetical protein